MSFGYQRQPRAFQDNTALLIGYLYNKEDEAPIPRADIASVKFTVVAPDYVSDLLTPSRILNDQTGQVSTTADGTGEYLVPATFNTVAGQYHAIAKFTYTEDGRSGLIRTVICDYDVIDPFERTGSNNFDPAVNMAWVRLEDCFDSEDGGPWLRDQTLNRFDKSKIAAFIPDVMFDINQYPPQTTYTSESYPWHDDGNTIAAQGLLVHTIRHLMRSYVEQPDVVNSSVGFHDRKRYLDAWTALYNFELTRYQEMIRYTKMQGFGAMSMLVSSKAGRMIPGSFRSRNVLRGF